MEFLDMMPTAAPEFVTVARAEAHAKRGAPWPISGDTTTIVQGINYLGRLRGLDEQPCCTPGGPTCSRYPF